MMSLKVDKTRRQNYGTTAKNSAIPLLQNSTASKAVKDVLEKKIEELSRQLAEEQQISRQNKLSVTRLKREITRYEAAEYPQKESLSKELEHERMLRVDAEHRLHEITQESDSCRSRLHALQEEFKKMEDMVQNMMQYKSKIDQLKQEKSSLCVTYENNLQKFGSHISDLERENMVLLNEVKKLESQMSNKTTGGRDKSKLLMERLRMLEKENSSLVLENEQQRQQYEKCLDEIANQVVQALLAQKMLREECMKLQNRVHDLELQNRQLSILFHQRMKLTSESVHQQGFKPDQNGEHDAFVQGSIESLQSIFSEQMSENLASMPQMSTPPPWLQERLSLTGEHFYGDRLSIISLPGSIQSTPDLNNSNTDQGQLCCRSVIETEFPATPSSPKMKHINVFERKKEAKRSSSTSSLAIPSRPSKVRTRSTSSLSRARGLSLSPQGMAQPKRNSGSHELISANQGNLQSGQTDSQFELANQQTTSQVGYQERVPGASMQTAISGTDQSQQSPVPSPTQQAVPRTSTSSSSPSSQSSSPTRKKTGGDSDKPQGHVLRQTSKLPKFSNQTSHNKEPTQTRRNSKTESGIRMGCQSPVSKSQSTVSNTKQVQPRSPLNSGQSSSVSSTSRIPSASKSSTKLQKSVKTTVKEKGGLTKQNSSSSSKLLPPGSPQVRHSGIKTTLKTESKISPPAVINTQSASINSFVTSMTVTPTLNVNVVNNTIGKNAPITNSSASKGKEIKAVQKGHVVSPMPQWRHEGPYANPRPETHFPRMGTTNLTHTSPKSEIPSPKSETVNTASAKIAQVPKASTPNSADSPIVRPDSFVSQRSASSSLTNSTKGQYFYDYSDEDSDWNRPVSKDFSIASSVSLDEMLDKTLENIDTPGSIDFTSDNHFLFKSPVVDSGAINENNNVPNEIKDDHNDSNCAVAEINDNDSENRLRGKPDIVKDTEECEQRNLKKSLTISQIPGSGMAGYRARRPKSLILGSKDKKFVYAEYGSSSSLDSSSDESWSYQASFAKNNKQQEIQSRVAKSLNVGVAKEVETPTNISTLEVTLNAQNDKNNKNVKPTSQIPRPNLSKKSVKMPPPVAQKPVRRKGPSDHVAERPKSVEICVNTVLAPSVTKPVTCFPYYKSVDIYDEKDFSKFTPDKFSTLPQAKTENGDKKLDTSDSFDEVTVERSGSRDDGYSTMSSDVQPEAMEKFSDDNLKERHFSHDYNCDSSTITKRDDDLKHRFDFSSDPDSSHENSVPSSERKSSSHSLSSPVSVSSEDRHSQYGSLGRVKAMKLKYEIEIQNRSPEREIFKSPPQTPPKSPKRTFFADKVDNKAASKIPLIRQSSIPPSSSPQVPKLDSKLPLCQNINIQNKSGANYNPPFNRPANEISINNSNVSSITQNSYKKPNEIQNKPQSINIIEQFDKLSYFMPPSEQISLLPEGGYDSSSSASERGSDLTSLHISEDNILSDIPEEKDGYESSVGKLSEANSLTSIPLKEHHLSRHEHTCCQHHNVHFEVRLRKYWLSLNGLMRGASESDVNKQNDEIETSYCDEVYGSCLNMDTPLERSASESDISKKRDDPSKWWLPKLPCGRQSILVDEIEVEGRVSDILKQIVFQQLTKTAESADSDDKTFSNYVEMLLQKGHIMDTSSSYHNMETSLQSRMSVSCSSGISSKEQYSCEPPLKGQNSNDHFEQEERLSRESSCGPVGEEQKLFNSQFYSLCNVGSNHSISENSENKPDNGSLQKSKKRAVTQELRHNCDNSMKECKKCIEEQNAKEFDEISKQIESLSKTVNELHRSLTSLNSENNDSGSESNEGDHSSLFNSAIGNKEIDGYQWLEDEFFLSPYGGEIILGTSPFSDTGASCDWMNEYMADGNHFDETYTEHEALHEGDVDISSIQIDKELKSKHLKSDQSSILAGMMDDEGNFNSQEFISQRLKQEELKLGNSETTNSQAPSTGSAQSDSVCLDRPLKRRGGFRPALKEELHTTPEKDDDTSLMPCSQMLQSELGGDSLSLSQDSLDDNIGVDQVMCHRLLGEGRRKAELSKPGCRPALDFSSRLFTRYGDLEKEAVAAFDFLNDEPATVTSLDSLDQLSYQEVERRVSHDPNIASSVNGANIRLSHHCNDKLSTVPPARMEDKRSHDQLSFLKTERTALHDVSMDQSVSSTDSYLSPVKRNRRKLRAKVKKGEQANSKRALRRVTKFSSTSADESFDDLSFSDSCCYHSYSSSSDSLEDKV